MGNFGLKADRNVLWLQLTLVAIDALGAVTLVATMDAFALHGVDWDLVVVGPETMAVGIRVGEQTTLWKRKNVQIFQALQIELLPSYSCNTHKLHL